MLLRGKASQADQPPQGLCKMFSGVEGDTQIVLVLQTEKLVMSLLGKNLTWNSSHLKCFYCKFSSQKKQFLVGPLLFLSLFFDSILTALFNGFPLPWHHIPERKNVLLEKKVGIILSKEKVEKRHTVINMSPSTHTKEKYRCLAKCGRKTSYWSYCKD